MTTRYGTALWCVSVRYAVFTLSRKKRGDLTFVISSHPLRRERSQVRILPCLPGIVGDCRFDLRFDWRCTAIGTAFFPRTRAHMLHRISGPR